MTSWGVPKMVSQIKTPIMEIREKLNSIFVGREAEVDAIVVGLLSREPVILVGAPGTAKTALIESLGKLVGGKVFTYLLSRFTEPDELFGALDIKAYREGKIRRVINNTILSANIVFLDEIFKASSAIRNTLLRVLNEKEYRYGDMVVKVEWLGFYSASNEVSTDAEDMAFYDRLVIRRFVKYVSNTMWKELLIRGIDFEGNTALTPLITIEDVKKFQSEVIARFKALKSGNGIIEKYIEALARLQEKGIVLSDRRKIKVLKVASAYSVLYGSTAVSLDDVADALRVVAIHNEDDVKKVEEVIAEVGLSQASQLMNEIQTLVAELKNVTRRIRETNDLNEFKELRKQGKVLIKELIARIKRLEDTPRANTIINEIEEIIKDFKESVSRILGD